MVAREQVATVPVTATVEEALDRLTAHPAAGLVLVMDEQTVVGVLTAFDIARLGGVQIAVWPQQGSAQRSPGSQRTPS
jgi:CBS domain-containing protein